MAGTLRRRETNIGVVPRYIAQRSMQTIDQDGSIRQRYLDALLEALVTGDCGALIAFARSS
jgi:hypothetical protein